MTDVILDSLPYIDSAPTVQEVEAANALISQELPSQVGLHSSIRTPSFSFLTPFAIHKLNDLEANPDSKLDAIDISRYSNNTYLGAAMQYSLARQDQLKLISQYGGTQWKLSNQELEQSLKTLENELQQSQNELTEINLNRKRVQESNATLLTYLTTKHHQSLETLVELNIELERAKRQCI